VKPESGPAAQPYRGVGHAADLRHRNGLCHHSGCGVGPASVVPNRVGKNVAEVFEVPLQYLMNPAITVFGISKWDGVVRQ
jgi:hypothetical protein